MQTLTLTFRVQEAAEWELLLRIIAQMNGLQLVESKPISLPQKSNLKRFYGVLSGHSLALLEQDFNQMRDEWERNF